MENAPFHLSGESTATLSVPPTLVAYLRTRRVRFELIPHTPADTGHETAEAAHVPGGSLAKAVVVETSGRCFVVVLSALQRVHLGALRREFGRVFALATEQGVKSLFPDCDPGSTPPFGQAYGIKVLLDESLVRHDRVYVASGSRTALIALVGEEFRRLMVSARRGRYGHS
jgi:Ala-tRNA(Pro) deacylase